MSDPGLPRTKSSFEPAPRTAVHDGASAYDTHLVERKSRLTVLTGTSSGLEVDVDKSPFLVGKGDGADLSLGDATVSREHFVIEQQVGGFVIRDQQSTNGTWIDQFRIREAYLRPGTIVRAGEVQLRFDPLFKQVDVRPSEAERFGSLVGRSVPMRQVFALLERVAKTEATIVLLGETGTGKSAVARAIHDESPRKSGPFITVDCGAIAENLVESELFGHERGAFTGAVSQRRGALEQAQRGTLFVDELADLPFHLQPRLLRVLEEREVRRVGGNEAIKLDVRVIAASRKDLWREVEAGRFREDLYFRLAVFTIPLPPLRERKEDIPTLAVSFAGNIAGGEKLLQRLTPDVTQRLTEHPFFGNVRELRNVVERAIHLDGDPTTLLSSSLGGPESTEPGLAVHSPTEEIPIVGSAAMVSSVGSGLPERPLSGPPVPVVAPRPVAAPAPTPLPPLEPVEAAAPTVGDAASASALAVDYSLPFKDAKEQLLETFEAEYLRQLVRAGESASAMARTAGIDRKHLYNLAKKHGVDLQKRG